MEFEITGQLKQLTIKPGAADQDGHREPSRAIIQIEVPVTNSLGRLGMFVGQEVQLTIRPFQMSFDEAVVTAP